MLLAGTGDGRWAYSVLCCLQEHGAFTLEHRASARSNGPLGHPGRQGSGTHQITAGLCSLATPPGCNVANRLLPTCFFLPTRELLMMTPTPTDTRPAPPTHRKLLSKLAPRQQLGVGAVSPSSATLDIASLGYHSAPVLDMSRPATSATRSCRNSHPREENARQSRNIASGDALQHTSSQLVAF